MPEDIKFYGAIITGTEEIKASGYISYPYPLPCDEWHRQFLVLSIAGAFRQWMAM